MSSISHHIPDSLLAAYASGNLPHAFSLVVAAHVSMCTECRAALEAHRAMGGVVLDASADADLSDDLRDNVMALLDAPTEPEPEYRSRGIYSGPVVEALKGKEPKWKRLGAGVKQSILCHDDSGSARLLYIPSGTAVPDHGHTGLELTLVLQGSFSDETGQFGVGDLEIADGDLEHTPVADPGLPCICLAATEGPLRFNAFIPKLLQPLFRI